MQCNMLNKTAKTGIFEHSFCGLKPTMMKLYGSYTSPYVRHCRIALAQSGLVCEFVETDYEQSAEQSPACRVPYLRDGDLMLTDSASIVRHLREQAAQDFLPTIHDLDLFLLVNTAMDSSINLFLLEKDGVTPRTSAYLARQQRRIVQILTELERRIETATDFSGDGTIRLGCFLSWALFRRRISLDSHPRLTEFQRHFESDPAIAATHPATSG